MDRPSDAQLPARKGPPAKAQYLVGYNGISAVLWLTVLLSTVSADIEEGYTQAYSSVFEYVKWVQTLAVMEILHAAFGRLHPAYFLASSSPDVQALFEHLCSQL